MREMANCISTMGPDQMINKFPGVHEVTGKYDLAFLLLRMKHLLPGSYWFVPRTLVCRAGATTREEIQRFRDGGIVIVKPAHGAHGDGIFLSRSEDEIMNGVGLMGEAVVQEYVDRPMLQDGLKFDLRLYVLVTSVNPLEAFLAKEGLARFCTEPYRPPDAQNLRKAFMHLTNYAVNKGSENFVFCENPAEQDDGSKRLVTSVLEALRASGADPAAVWGRIRDVVAQTLHAIAVPLAASYRAKFGAAAAARSRCFQIIGFDVLLGEDGKPWLLEINSNPSLRLDFEKPAPVPGATPERVPSPLDEMIKEPMFEEALRIVEARRCGRPLPQLAVFEPVQGSGPASAVLDRCVRVFGSLCGRDGQMASARFNAFGRRCGVPEKVMRQADFDILYLSILRKRQQACPQVEAQAFTVLDFVDALTAIAEKIVTQGLTERSVLQTMEKLLKGWEGEA